MNPVARISVDELAAMARAVDFCGAVSVAMLDENASAIDLAFGPAERVHGAPNLPATRFAMASGSKAFTAIAIGALIEEGRIALDSRLADCVGSRRLRLAPGITIGQLLNHTSGVPDYFDEETQSDFAALWRARPCYAMTKPADFLPLFEDSAMTAAPGTVFRYSNAGYVLLGLAIEAVTGQDFRDLIAERVFRPAGMVQSGYFAMDALPEGTATGYRADGDGPSGARGWRSNIFSVPSIGGPDGGAFTTLADLRRFWLALLGGRLLGPETTKRFLSPSVPAPEENRHYGLGVWLRQRPEGWIVSVEGSDPGASMESLVRLCDNLVVTVLSNHDDGAWPLLRALTVRLGLA